ncbi:MAG: hypothetical protein FWF34_01505 [Alphaproteobacteria bacterium]|nr:hypothetical protein [Alphaproteobacteria bacterium]MCL2889915.1 hypothetical protein [Alphaproteobacteria bacterium]
MKKLLILPMIAMFAAGSAMASDSGFPHDGGQSVGYYRTVRTTTQETARVQNIQQQPVYHVTSMQSARSCGCQRANCGQARVAAPCAQRAAAPVRVHTHSEVINHYAVYQPVTVYQHVGNTSERQVVRNSCNRCAN